MPLAVLAIESKLAVTAAEAGALCANKLTNSQALVAAIQRHTFHQTSPPQL